MSIWDVKVTPPWEGGGGWGSRQVTALDFGPSKNLSTVLSLSEKQISKY